MTQEEYDLEHHALEVECDRRLSKLAKRGPHIHQQEYAEQEQRIEEWLSRQVDRLDRRFMEAV